MKSLIFNMQKTQTLVDINGLIKIITFFNCGENSYSSKVIFQAVKIISVLSESKQRVSLRI